jgi:hypothetical protein
VAEEVLCSATGAELKCRPAPRPLPIAGGALQMRFGKWRKGGDWSGICIFLGVLWMVIGGLFLIPAEGLMVFGGGIGLMPHARGPCPGLFQLLLFVAGGSGSVRGTGPDVQGLMGEDGGHHPGNTGAVSSTVWDGVGRVLVVGSAGR